MCRHSDNLWLGLGRMFEDRHCRLQAGETNQKDPRYFTIGCIAPETLQLQHTKDY